LSPGNPNARRIASLRKSILDAATDDDVQAIIRKMGGLAREGDVQAARVYLEYTVGKPIQVEISAPDGGVARIDVTRLMDVVLEVVGDSPEARYKVAAALSRISLTVGEQGSGPDD
jgi:hypothetical protein